MPDVLVVILLILCSLSLIFLGFLVGVTMTAAYISREIKKSQRRLEEYFGAGEEWKEKELDPKDENWLRKILGEDKDKDKEKK